jgi:hypothetical protein
MSSIEQADRFFQTFVWYYKKTKQETHQTQTRQIKTSSVFGARSDKTRHHKNNNNTRRTQDKTPPKKADKPQPIQQFREALQDMIRLYETRQDKHKNTRQDKHETRYPPSIVCCSIPSRVWGGGDAILKLETFTSSHSGTKEKTRQYKLRQDETRQEKTKQFKTSQHKLRQDEARKRQRHCRSTVFNLYTSTFSQDKTRQPLKNTTQDRKNATRQLRKHETTTRQGKTTTRQGKTR